MKEPIKMRALCNRVALLYASKRASAGIHFIVSEKITEAIVSDSDFQIKQTLKELAADRKKRAFKMQYANFYWIRRSLEKILTQEKDMPKYQAKQADKIVRGALADYMQDYGELTLPQKARSEKDV